LSGMDQGSDLISDFRARRIRTQITWENISAIRDSFPRINSPGQAPVDHAVGHARGCCGASVDHAPGFSAACSRLQRCGWGWFARSSDYLGKSWENPGGISSSPQKFWESPAGNSGEFREFCIIRRHRSRVLQSRPEKRRDLSHVTQPRARINVSCSRAGHKWLGDPHEEEWGGYRTRVPDRAGQGGTGTPYRVFSLASAFLVRPQL
jgi:hypothetical protein